MKKTLFTIMTIAFFLYGCLALVFSIAYQPKAETVEAAAGLSVSDIKDASVVFFDELNVVQRYAFETVDEYEDSESGYSDVTYRVYDASQPMDNYDLCLECYIVHFHDKTGTEYVTSMNIIAGNPDREIFTSAPVTLPACVSTPEISNDLRLLNNNDKELIALREAALDAYSLQEGLPRADFSLYYHADSTGEYQQTVAKDAASDRIITAVFGGILLGCGVFLLHLRRKKAKKAAV